MLEYSEEQCIYCYETTLLYHQYVADSCCESCGKWQAEDDDDEQQ